MIQWYFYYLVLWLSLFLIALLKITLNHHLFVITQTHYLKFISIPWKFATFLIAFVGLNAVGPYTGDPTWDFATASFMSILTYLTAPWGVGILFRAIQRKEPFWQVYVSMCLWLFSASWSYDLYLLIRDGYYPITWSANLFASSILYLCAGLFWNLSFKPERGVHFAFTEQEWIYVEPEQPFVKIFWYALPFMILVSAMILYFLVPDGWF